MAAKGVRAEIRSGPVEYKEGDTVLEGVSVYGDASQGRRPAVLVVQQWMGLTDYEKKRAEMLARLGYNVFAADVYGKGVRPKSPQAAAAEAANSRMIVPCGGGVRKLRWMCWRRMN